MWTARPGNFNVREFNAAACTSNNISLSTANELRPKPFAEEHSPSIFVELHNGMPKEGAVFLVWVK